jgi:hypothetical protein
MKGSFYPIGSEPTNEVYLRLIDLAQEFCMSFLLVVRPTISLDMAGIELLDMLKSFLLSREDKSSWPGTDLFDEEKAIVYTYRLCSESANILKKVNNTLYGWVQPNYPEDLCFVKKDGVPWLITISHEHEAFLVLNAEEKEFLSKQIPELTLLSPVEQ